MKRPTFVTIPFSHYCEKARWALDRAGIAYTERGHMPLFAWVPALLAGGGRTVPTLVTDDGPVTDSTEILRWADRRGDAPPLFPGDAPEAAKLEEDLDHRLGPHARRLAYSYLLPELRSQVDGVHRAPAAERTAAKLFAPAVNAIMRRGMRIDDAGVARSRVKVDEVLAEIGARLADGRRYLVGDRLTAADVTFAALATPLVLPPELADFVPMASLPAAMVATRDLYRATPAGTFAMRLYAEDRGKPGARAT